MVKILGIESSCDETAAAVVADGREILSSIVASQVDIHRKYGGVVPELASREHLRQIVPIVREALEQAKLDVRDVDEWIADSSSPYGKDFCPRKGRIPGARARTSLRPAPATGCRRGRQRPCRPRPRSSR